MEGNNEKKYVNFIGLVNFGESEVTDMMFYKPLVQR